MAKRKECKYPNLLGEMARNGETQGTLAKLLGLSNPSITRRLTGEIEWRIWEVETICEHYKKDYYQLFK